MDPNKVKKFHRLKEIQNTYENDCQIYYPTKWDGKYLAYKDYRQQCIQQIRRSSYLYEATIQHFYEKFPMGTLFCHNWNCETIFDTPNPYVPMVPLYSIDNGLHTYYNQLEDFQTYDNFEFVQDFDNNELEEIQTVDNQFENVQTFYNEHFEDVDQEDIQCIDFDYKFMENNTDTTQYSPFTTSEENIFKFEKFYLPRKSRRHHRPNLTLGRFLNIKSESRINKVKRRARRIRTVKAECANKRSYSNLGSIVHSAVHIEEITSSQASSCHLEEIKSINESSHEEVCLDRIEIDNITNNDVKTCKTFSQVVSSGSPKFSSNELTTLHEQVDIIPSDNPGFQIHTKDIKSSKAFSKTVACGSPRIISRKETTGNEVENLKMDHPSLHISTEKCIPSNTLQSVTTWSNIVKGEKHTTTCVSSKTVKKEVESKNAETKSPKPRKVKFNKKKRCTFAKLNKLSTLIEIIVEPEQNKEQVVQRQQPEFSCYRTVPQQSKILVPTEIESKYRSYKHAVVGVQEHSIVPDITQPKKNNDSTTMKINAHLGKPTNCAPECKIPLENKEVWILKESKRKRSTKTKNIQ